jgi:hypothetical protein
MEDARQILAMALHRMIENKDSSSLSEGFIMTSFRHAVTDCHRKKYGRGEPRAWLKAFGDLGKRLFELYCLAKMKRMEVLESVDSELSTSSEVSVKPQAEELLNEMDHRRECAGKAMQETPLQGGSDEDVEIPDRNNPEDELQASQVVALRAYLFGDLGCSYQGIEHVVEKMERIVDSLSGVREFDDDQRFIIHATLSGKLTEKQIGELLDLSVRQVRYKRSKTLDLIKIMTKKAGIVLSDLLDEANLADSPAGWV